MNRSYKVIWNEALQCFTAVAENAKAKGKSSKSSISASALKTDIGTQSGRSLRLNALRSALIAVGLTSLAIGMSSQAIAAVGVNGGTGSGTAISECTNDSQANSGTNKENIAIGCESSTSNKGYQIADRGNPYYTDNEFTPGMKNGGSVAIGTGASTEHVFSVAIGEYAKTTSGAGVAIGVGSLSEGNTALAIGRQSVARGDYSQAMGNVASATGDGSLAVGHSATATGYRGIAIGSTDIDGAGEVAGQDGAAYQFIGQTKASGRDTIALGSGAQATADNALSLGSGAQATADNALSLGTSSAATKAGSVALGNGSNTNTNAESVTSATVGGVKFDNFAGAANAAGDQVSVGASGQERQIKNVAAGDVMETSTDAINGSQLFSVADTLSTDITNNTTNITNNTTAIGRGLSFTGDNTTVTINRKLGQTLTIKGGATELTENNIGVVADGEGSLNVKLSKDLMGLNTATFGNVIVSTTGLNNGGNRITNVARATEGTDAVNFDQLNEVRDSATSANQGFNVTAQGENTSTVRPGDTVDLNNQDDNIVVSKDANNNNVSFDLNKDIDLDSATFGDVVISSNGLNNGGNKITNVSNGTVAAGSSDAITGDQLNNTADSITGVIGGNAVNNGGVITTTNIGGTGQDTIDGAIGSIQQGTADTNEAVSNNTTNIASNTTNITNNTNRLDGGLNFGADSGNNINKPIGDDSVLGFVGGNNITTTAQGSSIRFDLNNNINVDSVTTDRVVAGNTTVNDDGVTVTGGPNNNVVVSNNGLDNGGNTITNVADGVEDSDAVNVGQLNDQFDSIDRVINGQIADMDSKLEGKVDSLGYRIDDVEDDANAGISAAMAMSSLPQAYIPGKSMVGGGVASYNGESAVAIGVSRVSDNGRWVMKINGTADTQGNAGGAIGAGFHF
ncbi:YadA-like family protein [Psychrobacter sp. 1U1]|uniref:YadA family autotransporter adhesin n=2 Tax=unclassified Psychrobacter TaxID=196806 RepID=UPI003F47F518